MNERVIYSGRQPLNIGMNRAKRVAKSADRRDNLIVQDMFGFGLPRHHAHHQTLVFKRRAYYTDVYQQEQERKQCEYESAERLSAIGFGTSGEGVGAGSTEPDAEGISEPTDRTDLI